MQDFVEGLGRMKGQCSIKFKMAIQGNLFMSAPFFFEDCPEGNLNLRAKNLFHYKLEEKNGHTAVLRVLRMRRKGPLDKEDEITLIALPPNTKSFCVEFRHQKPKKSPFPILIQLVTA